MLSALRRRLKPSLRSRPPWPRLRAGRWQRLRLAQAICWLWRGAYQAALANADLALTPASERAPLNDPVTESFTTQAPRQALAEVEAEPVRPFPVLGPILFTGR